MGIDMNYILWVVLMMSQGISSTQQEFYSKEACENAARDIKATFNRPADWGDSKVTAITLCTSKGS